MPIKLSRRLVKELKILKRKFVNIEEDLDAIFSKLSVGTIIGNRIQEFKGLEIYKARVRNSSSNIGSRGGFRVVYYIRRPNNEIIALSIYSKNQKQDISKKEILEILKQENLVE